MINIKQKLSIMVENVREELTHAYEGNLEDEYGELVSLWEYLTQSLSVDFRIDSKLNILGVRVWFCLGGPNIWIDTETKTIEGHWGITKATLFINKELVDAINDEFKNRTYWGMSQ